jgi:hypothetical protein
MENWGLMLLVCAAGAFFYAGYLMTGAGPSRSRKN